MFKYAEKRIAFCAKPILEKEANIVIKEKDLSLILNYLRFVFIALSAIFARLRWYIALLYEPVRASRYSCTVSVSAALNDCKWKYS